MIFSSERFILERKKGKGLIYLCGAIFFLFSLLALLLAGKGIFRPWVWAAYPLGGLLFALVPLTQEPLQNWVLTVLSSSTVPSIWRSMILVLVSGILQESYKFLVLGGWSLLSRGWRTSWQGALLGGGFAFGESIYILLNISDYIGFLPFVFFLERFFVTLFHIGLSFFLGWGFDHKKVYLFYPLAIFLHIVMNLFAVLHQYLYLGLFWTEVIVAILSSGLFSCALLAHLRERKKEDEGAAQDLQAS